MGSLAGCGVTDPDEPDLGEITSAATVGTYETSGCSTAVVRGLSVQIAEEVDCMSPNSLVKFGATSRIAFSSNAVLPYLHSKAKADLTKVAAGAKLTINSGYRTVAQQYLLYRWKQQGRCGITAAATPGSSNHESGRAIDLANWSSRVSAMRAHNWSHSVPGDPVHFDHTKSPDNRGKDVEAFQRLWNRNHPSDKIAVDGDYGPQTAARLKKSPATGFTKGATCKATERGAQLLAIDGPDRLAPGASATYTLTVANNEETAWSADTMITVAGGGASDFYDAQTWASASEVAPIGMDIAAGGQGILTVDIRAPLVSEETPGFTTFALIDPSGAQVGAFDLAVTITPNGDEHMSGDAGDDHGDDEGVEADEDGVKLEASGCSVGGGAGGFGMLAIAGLLAVTRRRQRQ